MNRRLLLLLGAFHALGGIASGQMAPIPRYDWTFSLGKRNFGLLTWEHDPSNTFLILGGRWISVPLPFLAVATVLVFLVILAVWTGISNRRSNGEE